MSELESFANINFNGEVIVWANQPPENPQFTALLGVALEAESEVHVNIQNVAPNDVKAFEKAVERAIEDFDGVPEGWS